MLKYYTPREVAQELRVTERTIYEWLTTGRLRGMRAGTRWRIRPEDVQAFLEGTKGDAGVGSEPAGEIDAAEHAARVDALVGKYAHVPFSSEALFRERRQDAGREERLGKLPGK
jgi:excisionase family DNA binding protein